MLFVMCVHLYQIWYTILGSWKTLFKWRLLQEIQVWKNKVGRAEGQRILEGSSAAVIGSWESSGVIFGGRLVLIRKSDEFEENFFL